MKALEVDDEKSIRDMLAYSLRAECFEVDVAADGTEGSFLARINEYDLIILDNMMPEKTGSTVCHEIRQSGRKTPIIILSVLSDSWHKVELLNAGADDYLVKPFSFEELLARIRALLRRSPDMEGDILYFETLILNTKEQTVYRSERKIHLTRKEFMLLEYLVRNPKTVISRGRIMEHVWDMKCDPFSNTVETHVRGLRRKLDADGEPKIIYTLSGRGYKIDTET